YGVKKPK
ncbi:hypothetical protein H6P81_chloro000003, partial (chloroplast) [Aristolochia fimbriata]